MYLENSPDNDIDLACLKMFQALIMKNHSMALAIPTASVASMDPFHIFMSAMFNHLELKITSEILRDPDHVIMVDVLITDLAAAWTSFWSLNNGGESASRIPISQLKGRTALDKRQHNEAHDLRLDALLKAAPENAIIMSPLDFIKHLNMQPKAILFLISGRTQSTRNNYCCIRLNMLKEYLLKVSSTAYDADVRLRETMPFALNSPAHFKRLYNARFGV